MHLGMGDQFVQRLSEIICSRVGDAVQQFDEFLVRFVHLVVIQRERGVPLHD